MNRILDIFISLIILFFFIPFFLIISLLIKFDSKGPVIFWQKRVGLNNKYFMMPKLRSMKFNTKNIAKHKFKDFKNITSIGKFLRKYSIDEMPQFYSVLIGDMTLIGPRPALYNQYDLISLRKKNKIDQLVPGITGWAQVQGRDNLSIEIKVKKELFYMKNKSLYLDIKIIYLTLIFLFKKRDIKH